MLKHKVGILNHSEHRINYEISVMQPGYTSPDSARTFFPHILPEKHNSQTRLKKTGSHSIRKRAVNSARIPSTMSRVTAISAVDHKPESYTLRDFLTLFEARKSPEESTNNISVIMLTEIQ
jgi:hypothetical protein